MNEVVGWVALGLGAGAIGLAPGWSKAVLAAPAALAPLVAWIMARPLRWVALFLAAALLLPPLPIPIGDSGPHPALLFAAVGLFAGLFLLRRWPFPGVGPAAPLLSLVGGLL